LIRIKIAARSRATMGATGCRICVDMARRITHDARGLGARDRCRRADRGLAPIFRGVIR
jgi:hypothetical protein